MKDDRGVTRTFVLINTETVDDPDRTDDVAAWNYEEFSHSPRAFSITIRND